MPIGQPLFQLISGSDGVSRFLTAHQHRTEDKSKKDITKTKDKPQKANNTKHSKTKLAWFSHFLRHSARKRGVGLFYNAPEPTLGLLRRKTGKKPHFWWSCTFIPTSHFCPSAPRLTSKCHWSQHLKPRVTQVIVQVTLPVPVTLPVTDLYR